MVEWQESLSIGMLEVDIQHKLLFEKFNAFLAACEAETEADGIYRLFWFLEAYAITHFNEEEKLMQRVGFPDYLKHREKHLAFAGEIAKLKEQLKHEGPTHTLVSTMTMFISGWLVNHISSMDRAIARFVA
ncbi:MAG: hemerythrin [Geobacteraceae bacterium GWC2_58_44]|nr:MAG: hemerythrin [Geobacteraceae bacterium GWC2_58_44]HBG06818.1 hemerythrin [Geobacter sp.]